MRDDSQSPLGILYREIVRNTGELKRIADTLEAAIADPLVQTFRDVLQQIAAEERAADIEISALVGMGAGSAAYAERALQALKKIRELLQLLDGGAPGS